MKTKLLALACTLTFVTCGGDYSGVGGAPSGGSLGNLNIAPECGALNQACLVQGLNAPLALGSTIELLADFRLAGSSGPPLTLETAAPSILTVTDSIVEAVGEGVSAVLFRGPDGAVVDFIHVWVSKPEELRIIAWSRQGDRLGPVLPEVQLLVGDEVLVSVEPYSAAQPLLGNYNLGRSIEGTGIAIVPDPIGGWYRIVAREPGQAIVTFSALDIDIQWDIEVIE